MEQGREETAVKYQSMTRHVMILFFGLSLSCLHMTGNLPVQNIAQNGPHLGSRSICEAIELIMSRSEDACVSEEWRRRVIYSILDDQAGQYLLPTVTDPYMCGAFLVVYQTPRTLPYGEEPAVGLEITILDVNTWSFTAGAIFPWADPEQTSGILSGCWDVGRIIWTDEKPNVVVLTVPSKED